MKLLKRGTVTQQEPGEPNCFNNRLRSRKYIIAVLLVALLLAGLGAAASGPWAESSQGQRFVITPPPPTRMPPGIPVILTSLDLGLPAGNGHSPRRIALDSGRQRLYTLNEGLTRVKEGNTLTEVDLTTGQVTRLLRLNNASENPYSQQPLELQADPYRPRLYARWGDPYGNPPVFQMTLIDADNLAVVETLADVAAIAAGPERLYLAGRGRLRAVDPTTLAELAGRKLDTEGSIAFLRLDAAAKLLYLGQNRPATLRIFAADSFTPLASTSLEGQLLNAVVDEANSRVLVLLAQKEQVSLIAVDPTGRILNQPAPVSLSDDTYAPVPVALAGSFLAASGRSGGESADRLRLFNPADLGLRTDLAVPGYPNDLAVDPASGRVYLAYSSPDSYVLAVDPASGQAEKIYTARTLAAGLADPAAGRLYVLDNWGAVRMLSLSDYTNIGEVQVTPLAANCQETPGCVPTSHTIDPGLALDPVRHRLYVNGEPVRVVDTRTLRVTAMATAGQVTPDPGGDRLYLTPPCQCRLEQCNTLILDAETLTGTQKLFPPIDPLAAPCVFTTRLDPVNQLLYAMIYNGIPGSNSGNYFMTFNVAGAPRQIYTASEISYGPPAFDPDRQRAFFARYRIDRSFLSRFAATGQAMTQTLELAGAAGSLAYDAGRDRLYVVPGSVLQVFDGELALLAEISLPDTFEPLAYDTQAGHLFLTDSNGHLLVVAGDGGQLDPPPPPPPTASDDILTAPAQRLFFTPTGVRFRIDNERLYRSDDGGQNWQRLGWGLPGRPVSDLAISPEYASDAMLLAGLHGYGRNGGLYRSTDGGSSWQPTTRGLTDLEIDRIVFSPTFARDRTVFVTTAAKGLFRSTDGSQTWQALAERYATDPYDVRVTDLAVSPDFARDNLLLIGYRHLLRSTDSGETWVDTGLPAGRVAFSPTFTEDGLILNNGQWRSADRGQSWQPAAAGLAPARTVLRLFFSPDFARDQTVYILLARDNAPPLLQRSTDAGRSWQALLDELPASFEPAATTALPDGRLYLGGEENPLSVSPDSLTWGSPAVDVRQLDLHDLAIRSTDRLFVANSSAGVFRSTDGGQNWQETGFPARASDLRPARLALAGNGTLFAAAGVAIEVSLDDGQTWRYLAGLPTGFEVASLAVSPAFAADGLVLAGGTYASSRIIRSGDGGQSWQTVFDGQTLGGSDVSLLAFSPDFATDGRVYAWLQEVGLLRSMDRGQTWQPVPGEYNRLFAQALLAGPGGQLYLGGLGGQLFRSMDGGQNWQKLSQGLPGTLNWSSALALGPNGEIFLGTDAGVYRSLDSGQSWQAINSGLPGASGGTLPQVRALQFQAGRLYAALVQGGLFVSDDLGQNWDPAGTVSPSPVGPTSAPATPAALPSPTPVSIACAAGPAYFTELWLERLNRLGCPTYSGQSTMAEQPFAGGRMFWRGDNSTIYALPEGQPYRTYPDTWSEDQPAYTCLELGPAQTPPTPQRGFGKVWCNDPELHQQLGNATGAERAFQATWQEFETGLIFQTEANIIYILDGTTDQWERIE